MKSKGYDYPDACIISRTSGVTDIGGNEVFVELYNGCGEIQYGGSGGNSLHASNYQSETILFVPVNDILFKTNDKVVVVSKTGRSSKFTIEQFESIEDDSKELNDTCIWLKGGIDE